MQVDPTKLGTEVASFDRSEILSALLFITGKVETALSENIIFRISEDELTKYIIDTLQFDKDKARLLSEYLCSKITKGIENDTNLKEDFDRLLLVRIFARNETEFSCLEIYDTEAALYTKVGHC